tara:strand:+ start:3022 stop:3291 length:270 start_codon:yes stop_codon:yes gene_type:complete
MKPESFTLTSSHDRYMAHRLIDSLQLEKQAWMITVSRVDQAEETHRQLAIDLIRAKAKINELTAQLEDTKQRLLNTKEQADKCLQERKT